jgi:dTDP-4-amino-4,6-dideoxygalactose transaminase
METLRALIRGDLPPVGHPISCAQAPFPPTDLPFGQAICHWVNSGTAALALALQNAVARRPDILRPEVIIPGYGCPDLVAACLFAQCTPVALDTATDAPGLNIQALAHAINKNTLAVVAVNFLGIADDLAAIKQCIDNSGETVALIEDNAQWFPETPSVTPFTVADYRVFSFGKGKPLSLLGGGLLLSEQPLEITAAPAAPSNDRKQAAKIALYNRVLWPRIYWWLNHNPIFSPGKTQFHPLQNITTMDDFKKNIFSSNWRSYCSRSTALETQIRQLLQNIGYKNPLDALPQERQKRRLRYPLLCPNQHSRDQLLLLLNQQGLGASRMYPDCLMDLPDVCEKITLAGPLPNARHFAQRIITLPCHTGVTQVWLERLHHVLQGFFGGHAQLTVQTECPPGGQA